MLLPDQDGGRRITVMTTTCTGRGRRLSSRGDHGLGWFGGCFISLTRLVDGSTRVQRAKWPFHFRTVINSNHYLGCCAEYLLMTMMVLYAVYTNIQAVITLVIIYR